MRCEGFPPLGPHLSLQRFKSLGFGKVHDRTNAAEFNLSVILSTIRSIPKLQNILVCTYFHKSHIWICKGILYKFDQAGLLIFLKFFEVDYY